MILPRCLVPPGGGGALADKIALRWRGKHGDACDITCSGLAADVHRFGNARIGCATSAARRAGLIRQHGIRTHPVVRAG